MNQSMKLPTGGPFADRGILRFIGASTGQHCAASVGRTVLVRSGGRRRIVDDRSDEQPVANPFPVEQLGAERGNNISNPFDFRLRALVSN